MVLRIMRLASPTIIERRGCLRFSIGRDDRSRTVQAVTWPELVAGSGGRDLAALRDPRAHPWPAALGAQPLLRVGPDPACEQVVDLGGQAPGRLCLVEAGLGPDRAVDRDREPSTLQ